MKNFLNKFSYELKLTINLLILLIMLGFVTFNIIQQLATIKLPTDILKAKRIYILKSNSTIEVYKNFGLNEKIYIDRVERIKDLLIEIGFTAFIIDENKISQIPKDGALFLPDDIGLENYTITQLIDYVKKGGKLLFNFKSGFNSVGKREYKNSYLIEALTNFEYIGDFNYPNQKKVANPKIVSPLITDKLSREIGLAIYDKLPYFKYPYWVTPSLIATKVGENRALSLNSEERENQLQNAGLLWNGSYFKGKWVYFNFPAYTLIDSVGYRDEIKELLKGMFNYLFDDIVIKKYPLFDRESGIMLSGTFKYQYQTIKDIAKIVQEKEIPFTAFLSSEKVSKNISLTKHILDNSYLEIGSMGYISEKITGKSYEYIKKEIKKSKEIIENLKEGYRVYGFYPPKKAFNQPMLEQLQFNNYKYIIDFSIKSYLPYFKYNYYILSMPVSATNDEKYLLNPDITQNEIVDNMKKDVEFITYINGLYSLNIQSHLMAYDKNKNILKEFFSYLKKRRENDLFFGKEVYDRVNSVRNIEITFKISAKNYILTIKNKNDIDIKNFKFRLYLNPNTKIKRVATATGSERGSFLKIKEMEYEIMINRLRKSSESVYLVSYEKDNN